MKADEAGIEISGRRWSASDFVRADGTPGISSLIEQLPREVSSAIMASSITSQERFDISIIVLRRFSKVNLKNVKEF